MIGSNVSHYKIIDKLGEGGMGVVYKAEDTKLDRVVALKFLPQALTADPVERDRFYQEARAASQLLHPNVTAIFEINESDGQIYLAMEYVGGTTLKKRIQHENPIPLGKGLDLAIQLCTGISAAHEKGIVHRDIKSENILITPKGDLKITDFGLAKLKGATKLTKTGSTLGTAAYMSPEQARGEDVDARSDIFSCGVVFYELFTGKLPFEGEHQAAILYSLVNEEPSPLARFSSQTTPELQRIVSKALAKEKEERYQHADEMLADLKRERKGMEYARSGFTTAQPQAFPSGTSAAQTSGMTSGPSKLRWAIAGILILLLLIGGYFYSGKFSGNQPSTNSQVRRIAVLPFENVGPSDKEYFADGLTDEIRTKLSGLSGLAVIARASSMQYKKTTKSVSEIGADLNVGYLLQGTIRWEESGNAPGAAAHLLVTPSLVKISDGTQVWSQSFEVTQSSVFQMQSDIAQQVSGALAVALNPVDKQTIESKPTTNSEAYDYYLRGLELIESFSKRDLQEGIRLFSKATELDPKFGGAYAQLCRISAFAVFGQQMPDSLLGLAKKSLDKVLELEPNSYDANYAQGYYYYYAFRNYDQALRYFTPALDAQPNNTILMKAISFVKRRQAKFQESRDLLVKCSELDPQAWRTWFELAYNELVMRQYRSADEHLKRALLVSRRKSTSLAGIHSLVVFSMNGDVKAAHDVYDAEVDETTSWLYRLRNCQFHMAEGNLTAARNDLSRSALGEVDIDSASYFLSLGTLDKQTGSPGQARARFDTARGIAQHAVLRNPKDFIARSNLGIALAYLGDKAGALEQGKKAVELMPLEKDPLDVGPQMLYTLVQIYAITGDSDSAIDTLDRLLSIPNIYSVRFVELDPDLKSLNSSPRFQKMLEKYRQAS